MRFTPYLVLAPTAAVAFAQLFDPLHRTASDIQQQPQSQSVNHAQIPLAKPAGELGPAMPPSGAPQADGPANAGGGSSVMLSDVMGRDKSINLFAGFLRSIESPSQRLDDPARNTTVLAPLNSAIESLPRKPWEDPRDYSALGANAYEGEDGQGRAQRNLRRFVEAHLIPTSPWPAGEKIKPVGGDTEVWWEEKDGVKRIQPGDIEVLSVGSSVVNGEVWILNGVRNAS
ncbi:uncharacterized protein B0T23DRAFT_384151 [Neurospora hispaniola]|uniref:FAS1 domain-containing protein n=1 Tax=Neurospora hispaniola TaxID=588809 RepID=A0AAJ0I3Q9_9PEZI|nr:hypothetical protein B0T23DRAFT_384151 [Neurospora hispaniola]